jgi:hypothetical protein
MENNSMASQHYHRLLEEISQLTLIPETVLSQELTHLSIRGVDFSMYPVGNQAQAHLVIHCDLGSLPDKRREEVLSRLLDTNFHMVNSAKPVTFCRNEQSGHMMLSAAQPLSGLTGQAVLDQMGSLADYALAWRQNFFLSDTTSKPRTPVVAKETQLPRTSFSRRAL